MYDIQAQCMQIQTQGQIKANRKKKTKTKTRRIQSADVRGVFFTPLEKGRNNQKTQCLKET